MQIFKVDFYGMWPVGNCLIIAATDVEEATKIAAETIKHTDKFTVEAVRTDKPCVIVYLSGDY